MPPLLTFAADHPGLAFLLSFPTALVLCVFSWCFAGSVISAWSTLVNGLTTGMALLVTLVRGYPPSKVTLEDLLASSEHLDTEIGPDSAQDEGNDTPRAS